MSLTRVYFQNLNSNIVTFSDSITVSNFGNVANRDIGELFDRSQGGGSNVAVIWNETTQSFRLIYTSSTGKEGTNLAITGNANLRIGTIYAESFAWANGTPFTSAVPGGSINQLQYNAGGYFAGAGGLTTDGSNLTSNANVTAAAVYAATIGNTGASLVGTITTADQTNITTVGTLSNLAVAGTINATTVQANTIGNIGATLIGNGAQITSITGSEVTGTVANATNAVTAIYVTGLTGTNVNVALGYVPLDSNAKAVSAGTADYVVQPIQSNITQVGTLSNLVVAGIIDAVTVQANTIGNVGATLIGNGAQITSITGSQVTGVVANATNAVTAIYVTGLTGTNVNVALGYVPLDSNAKAVSAGTADYVIQPIQSNITQVGELSNLQVAGTIDAATVQANTIGNVGATLIGNGAQITSLTGSEVTGVVANATNAVTAIYVTGLTGTNVNVALGYVPLDSNAKAVSANTADYVIQPIQSNITQVGILSNLQVAGTIDAVTVQANTIGNVGATLIGNGAQITSITGSEVTGVVANATNAVTAIYVTGLTGTNVNVALGYVPLDSNAKAVSANTADYVIQPIQSNITQVGILGNLQVANQIDASTVYANIIGNVGATLYGNGSQLTSLTGSEVTGVVANATNAVTAIYVTGLTGTNVNVALGYVPLDSNAKAVSAGTADYVIQPIQSNITQVGILSNLQVANQIDAHTIYSSTFGNAGAIFNGDTFNATTGFNGVLGAAGANTALISTLTTTGNATVSALTVNGTASIGSTFYAAGGVQNTAIGNLTQSSGKFTTLEATAGIQNTPIGNVTPASAVFTTVVASGNVTVANLAVNNSATIGGDVFIYGNLTVANVSYTNIEIISNTEIVTSNLTANGLTINTSATIGTTLGVTGNIYVGGILTDGYYYANGTPFIGGGGGVGPGPTILSNNQLGDGSTVNFTIPQESTTAATVISINGVVQEPSYAYTVTGTTVTFTAPPANGDRINFRLLSAGLATYLTDNAGTTGVFFDLSPGDRTATFKTNNVTTMTLDNNGYLNMKSNGFIISTPSITVGTGGGTMDTWSGVTYKAAKYLVTARDSGSTTWTTMEALVATNGASNAAITVYGVVNAGASGTEQVTLSATASAGTVTVTATGVASGTVVNFEKTYLAGS